MGHTSPVTLLGPRLRAGVYTLGTYVQPPPLPRVSVLADFEQVTRNASLPTTATIRLVRTPPFADQCSVQWSVVGTGPTPITAGYFLPVGLPFGLGIFEPGQQYLDITLTFSAGPLPPTDLFGIFEIHGASGCSILASQSSFQFRLLESPPSLNPWVWDEPVWIPRVSYAAAPGKVQITTAAELAQLATAEAGKTYVINGDIDGAGGNYTVTASGTQASPVRIIAAAAGATLRHCTLSVTGTSFLQIADLDLQGVHIEYRATGQMLQVEGCKFTNYNNSTGTAIEINGQCRARYFRIYGNEFLGFAVTAINTGVIIPKVNNTNHFKYVWIERNLFQDFTTVGITRRNFAFFWGEANPDADKNTFLTIKDNLIKNSQQLALFEIKIAGNARILGNTFERSIGSPYTAKIRFGSIKTRFGVKPTGTIDTAIGALIEGNMFVTPAGSSMTGDTFRIKDAGHRIVHNWGVELAPGEQPTLSSPLNGAKIGLGFGNMDMTWWPENVADFPEQKGRYWINTGFNVVAGNRMTVEVGSQENSIRPEETLWPATTNTVSAASPLRTDRNAAVTLFPPSQQIETTTDVVVLGVDYNQVPVRILTTTCGRNAP